jgi:hypothetical protein
MIVLYLLLGLFCFALLFGLTEVVARTEAQE